MEKNIGDSVESDSGMSSRSARSSSSYGMRWHCDALPYADIDVARMQRDEVFFYLLTTASFVEITTDLYTQNLVQYFRGDAEVQTWLTRGWEPEELQHGKALKRYVETAWPEFPWEQTYKRFLEEYRRCCQVEFLGPTRTLEMARRCIVEMGTCSYYTMIQRATDEPVLATLAANIRTDEAYHYKHFHEYFRRYFPDEKPGRLQLLKAIWGRIREIDGEDAFIAFKYVWLAKHPGQTFQRHHYRAFTRRIHALAGQYYPFRMAVHMAIKPLGLTPKNQRRWETSLSYFLKMVTWVTARFVTADPYQ